MRRVAAIVAALGLTLPVVTQASPLRARVSTKGLDFVSRTVSSLIPKQITAPDLSVDIADCAGGSPIRFVHKNTSVALNIENLAVTLPSPGIIRVAVQLSVEVDGQAHLQNIYACGLSEMCGTHVGIHHFGATIDFSASVDSGGRPRVSLVDTQLSLDPKNLDIELSTCPGSDLINRVVGALKTYAVPLGTVLVESMARDKVQPLLDQVLAGFTGVEQSVGPAEIRAGLSALLLDPSGITVEADIDLWSKFPAAVCVSENGALPEEPTTKAGEVPDLAAGIETDLAVGVNLGLIDDALYQVWREGMMCMSPSTLEAFGVHVDLDHMLGHMLPGFPEGTKFSFEASAARPPSVQGLVGEGAKIKALMHGVEATLVATLPDFSQRTLTLSLDAEMIAEVRVDPSVNALAMRVERARVTRLTVDDHFGLEDRGFDFARIEQVLEDVLLPKIFGEMGELPVTGPVFGDFLDTYVILRELKSNEAWLTAKLDLFHAPENDTEAPVTKIDSAPDRVLSPRLAQILVSGEDTLVPAELLRYRVTIDGTAGEPTYVRQINVGEEGVTKKYRVSVAAIDLAGNEDQTPEVLEVDVDGIRPRLSIVNPLYGVIDTTRPTLEWTATDDRSAKNKIAARLEVSRVVRLDGKTDVRPAETYDIKAGETRYTLPRLETGAQYQATLVVIDEAGNESADAMLFDVSEDADDGGCTIAVGGQASPSTGFLGLALLGLAFAFRRRR